MWFRLILRLLPLRQRKPVRRFHRSQNAQHRYCQLNWTTVFCRDDLDEYTAYALCKAMFENKEELVKAHSFFGDLAPENIVDSCIAPLHPGAEKYYKEVGVLA